MPSEIRIYFEGDKSLKPGFDAFFANIRRRGSEQRCRVSLVATGGTPEQDFSIALRKHPDAWNILLRDSEGPIRVDESALLCQKQQWPTSHVASIFWMVEMMESWFHADKDALAKFYGRNFDRDKLKSNPNVEDIPKKDLMDGLKDSTKGTKKGRYHKTRHAPALLELIAPTRVREAAPNCDKIFQSLLARLGE